MTRSFMKKKKRMFERKHSFEIVSIDGYTLISCQDPDQQWRNCWTTIYSQYPDVKIAEVDDHTEECLCVFLDEGFSDISVWIHSKPYPIRLKLPRIWTQDGSFEMQWKYPKWLLLMILQLPVQGEQPVSNHIFCSLTGKRADAWSW